MFVRNQSIIMDWRQSWQAFLFPSPISCTNTLLTFSDQSSDMRPQSWIVSHLQSDQVKPNRDPYRVGWAWRTVGSEGNTQKLRKSDERIDKARETQSETHPILCLGPGPGSCCALFYMSYQCFHGLFRVGIKWNSSQRGNFYLFNYSTKLKYARTRPEIEKRTAVAPMVSLFVSVGFLLIARPVLDRSPAKFWSGCTLMLGLFVTLRPS